MSIESTFEEDGAEVVRLRFIGQDEEGNQVHELRAAHVAEVLEGLVGLSSDFEKAGAFGNGLPAEVLVRPAQAGSFVIEVVRLVAEHKEVLAPGALGLPTLGSVIWWATKSMRAEVSDFDYLENGNVKVQWQDNTVDEVPREVWVELNKRERRRKSQLRKILAPLSDPRVTALEVTDDEDATPEQLGDAPQEFTLERTDYHLARPEDEVEETSTTFDTEAQMAAIDFESAEKWRVRTKDAVRLATVEDADFLRRVGNGLAIRKSDIFNLKIREDAVTKNGQSRRTWTVLEVKGHRRGSGDDDARPEPTSR